MKISLFYEFPLPRPWTEDDEHQVFFVGYNRMNEVVAQWQYSESVRSLYAVDDHIPAAAELAPLDLTPIYDDAAASGDTYEPNPHATAGSDRDV